MKTIPLVLCLGAALVTASCGQDGGADKRVAELEKQIAALQAQNRDTRAKLRAFHAFRFGSPLDNFFAAGEFWQCTYDSSWTDCSGRCAKQTAEGGAACVTNHPVGPVRQTCIAENIANGSKCLDNCPVQSSPAFPPTCF